MDEPTPVRTLSKVRRLEPSRKPPTVVRRKFFGPRAARAEAPADNHRSRNYLIPTRLLFHGGSVMTYSEWLDSTREETEDMRAALCVYGCNTVNKYRDFGELACVPVCTCSSDSGTLARGPNCRTKRRSCGRNQWV